MPVFSADSDNIKKAAAEIRVGGVVAFPTETVYGLGADAFSARAVAQIFEIKNRPHFDPLIVHIAELADLEKLADVNDVALRLAKAFWPGPLTFVLKRKSGIPDLVVSGLATVAVRMPSHPVALELIRAAKTPIAAPSANPFGYLSPTTAEHVQRQLGGQVDMILDGGACMAGVESTIVDLTGTKPRLLRPGGLAVEEIEKITGPLQKGISGSRPSAPGQLEQHYAPHKPLKVLKRDEIFKHPDFAKAGILFAAEFTLSASMLPPMAYEVLSPSGDLKESAVNLFAALHRLDESRAQIILAEPVCETGLGLAIMDRLRRAQATRR